MPASTCKWTDYRLPAAVQPTHYDVFFDVDLQNDFVTGNVTIQLNIDAPQQCIVLHADPSMTITAAAFSPPGAAKPTDVLRALPCLLH